jgi:hypothetical protein
LSYCVLGSWNVHFFLLESHRNVRS